MADEGKIGRLEALVRELQGGAVQSMPAGTVAATARAAAPDGWLLCDGAAVSRTTYEALFAAIGTAYGAGNGSTTFNVPDLRGRVPVGVDGAAARLAANDALGQASGAEQVALAVGEIPSHHHRMDGRAGGTVAGVNASDGFARMSGGSQSGQVDWMSGTFMENVGGGGAHNNMQPYQIVNWMVKA